MKKFAEKYGFELDDEYLPVFEKAKKLFKEKGKDIMNFDRLNNYTYMKPEIERIAKEVEKDDDNIIYSYFLYLAVKDKNKKLISLISKPCKTAESEIYDTLPIFGLLYYLPETVCNLRKKGVPEDVIASTCNMFENQIQDYYDLNHRYGISDYVGWLEGFLYCEIIRVGRFNFQYHKFFDDRYVFFDGKNLEIFSENLTYNKDGKILGSVGCEDKEGSFTPDIKETETEYIGCPMHNGICEKTPVHLDKLRWKKYICPGDAIINIHIPSGGRLGEECESDIMRGFEIINKCFGMVKGIEAESWTLSEDLLNIINKPASGLTWFSKLFKTFPYKSKGRDVFEYLYLLSADTPVEKLPENTSLQKKVKQHLANGGHIYETLGINIIEGNVIYR